MSGFEIDPASWATLNRLLDEALDLPAEERPKWLENLPRELEVLKPRLSLLLTHAAESGTDPRLVLRASDPRLSVDLKDSLFDDMRALPAFQELLAEVELRSSR